jgi:polyphosphate kinase
MKTNKKIALPELSNECIAQHFTKPEHRFINRELSWLAFNTRVLAEAQNVANPLLERIKFLSISANNLDEFTMVRIAGLMDQVAHGVHSLSADGQSPIQQLHAIQLSASKLIVEQQKCWLGLRKKLAAERVHVLAPESLPDVLSKADMTWLRSYFSSNIFPLLTPVAVDPAHPFPFIPNLGMVQVLELSPPRRPGKKMIALVPFPSAQPRFITLGIGKTTRLIALEDVIALCFEELFPGFTLHGSGLFRITRDSDLEIEEEAEDLMRNLDIAVKKRRYGRVVRVKTNRGVPSKLLQFMLQHLPADARDVVEVDGLVGLAHLGELYAIARGDLKYPSFKVRFPERINDFGGDCFAAIHAKDIVVHHPYESFDVVVQFLQQAALDPHVVSIKQTLYRTSHDSPIVKALIEAAENGKTVTALVELKARFDEEANIRLARSMERAGVQVVYGFVEMKTHAKLSLVTRREKGSLRTYAHFGTGNYHPATAKVYTDLSYFTCDADLCQDAGYVFNYITGYAKPTKFKKLAVAPLTMRKTLRKLIAAEIEHAKAGQPANIWAKLNALVDEETIDALYVASQAGVKIELVVRGICALKPGIPGFSENIRVRSLVGRFLEHARIYCFGNGHPMPSAHACVYISSADWMGRNLDRRVETMVPIENATVHRQVLDQIMVANLKDERCSWQLRADGHYHRISNDPSSFAAHDYFMHNPSLSGRGKALAQMVGNVGDEEAKLKFYKSKKTPIENRKT